MNIKENSQFYSNYYQPFRRFIYWLNLPSSDKDSTHYFRNSIFLHYQHAYAKRKRQKEYYRFLFFCFSFFFLISTFLIFFKNPNHLCGLYFQTYCHLFKHALNFVCLLLGVGALSCGYAIHPEKDALRELGNKMERESLKPKKDVQIEFNSFFLKNSVLDPSL